MKKEFVKGATTNNGSGSQEIPFSQIADAIQYALFIIQDWKIVFSNSAAEELTGYSQKELSAIELLQLLPEEDRESLRTRIQSRLTGDILPNRFEARLQTKDQTIIRIDYSVGKIDYNGSHALITSFQSIADRVATEKALRESEARYRRLTENAGDIIWRTDFYGTVNYVNQAIEHYLGYTPEEVVGFLAEQYLTSESIKNIETWIQDAILASPGKNHVGGRVDYICKDQTVVPFELSITLVKDSEGKIMALEGVSRDLRQRLKAEQEIREREELLSAVIAAGNDAIVVAGEKGTITTFNPAAQKMFGYKSSEVLGQSISIFMPREMRASHKKNVDNWFSSGKSRGVIGNTLELVAQRKNGERFPVELSLSAGSAGDQKFVLAVIRDITERHKALQLLQEARDSLEAKVKERTASLLEVNRKLTRQIEQRKKAEQIARESWAKYQAIVDTFDGQVYICSSDFKIEFMNKTLVERTGYDAVGESCFKVLHGLDDVCEWCVNEKVFKEKKTVRWEVKSPKDDKWFYVVNTPIRLPHGKTSKMAMIQDITERKNMEVELQKHSAEIELYNDILTHDINNINQTILTYLNMLMSGDFGELNDEQLSFMKICRKQIGRTTALVDKIKTISFLQTDSSASFVPIDLDYVISQNLKALETAVGRKNLTLDYTRGEGRMVLAGHLLNQLFFNLIENTLRHCQRDDVKVGIFIEEIQYPDKPYWKVSIEDNGPGVKDDFKPLVFNRFESGGKRKSSGLGLAIVKALANRYRGHIAVEDRVKNDSSRGSRFMVILPKA